MRMQNKPEQNTAGTRGSAPTEALRAWAEAGLAQRRAPPGEADVLRMVKTLQRLQPAAVSAIVATAGVTPAEVPTPADMSQAFAHALKTLAA
jgi:hypothetical protein